MALRIGIIGITGRMGQLLAREVAAVGAILVGGTIRPGSAAQAGITILADADALFAASDAVIDFSHAHAASTHAAAAARRLG